MSEVQAEKKTLLHRFRRWLIAFAAGFIPGATVFGYAMYHDLTHHQFDSDSYIAIATTESALKAGLICGGLTLAVFAAVSFMIFAVKRLFK